MENELKKVFIFDDNQEILDLCALILEEAGYSVKTSTTSNDIIAQVIRFMPNLILMDNWLPDIGGIEATKAIKTHKLLNHIPVVYFSANSEISKLAAQAGANNYLSKPFDIHDLEEIVKKEINSAELSNT